MQPSDEYSKFCKKFNGAPSWDWLNKNFKIKVEEEGFLLEQVRNSITEKLDMIARSVIEPIVSGGENFCCFYERGMLSAQQKAMLFEIYKNMQALLWKSNALNVNFSEKAAAEWLAQVKQVFDKYRHPLVEICERLAAGWENYKKSEVETAYHG